MALTEGIKQLKKPSPYPLGKPILVPPFLVGRGVRGVGPDLVVMPSLNCGTSVNTMSVVAKARKLKERLSEFFKEHNYDV